MTTNNTNNTNNTNATNTDRDNRWAIEILRDAYAASDESDYAILLAEHAQRVKEVEEQRLKRIETGEASANELLAEGFRRLGDDAMTRKQAKIQRAKIAQEKEEQERQARLDAVYGSMKR